LEERIAEEGQEHAGDADGSEDYFTDEDRGALFGFMYGVYIAFCRVVVFETIPTELVAAGTRHMRTSGCFFDWNLTLGALVRQKQEIDKTYHCFYIEGV
jgi:hypothetical protein